MKQKQGLCAHRVLGVGCLYSRTAERGRMNNNSITARSGVLVPENCKKGTKSLLLRTLRPQTEACS
jgi:hypothetical protein